MRPILAFRVAYLILFAAGAILGTALDHLHVAAGVLSYPSPFLFDQAAWVPPLFGFAVVAFAQLHAPFRPPAAGRRPPSWPRLLAALSLFAAAYAVTALGFRSPVALLGVLVPSWALLASGPGFGKRLAYGLLVAAAGTAFESALIALGGFRYLAGPAVLRVPIWLPALYLHASLLTAQLDGAAAQGARGEPAAGRPPHLTRLPARVAAR